MSIHHILILIKVFRIVQDAAEWQKHKEVNPSAGTAPQAVAEPEV